MAEIDRAKAAVMYDYEARRCCVCDCRHPSFGFGPPMTREPVWSCGAHHAEVEARLLAGVSHGGLGQGRAGQPGLTHRPAGVVTAGVRLGDRNGPMGVR